LKERENQESKRGEASLIFYPLSYEGDGDTGCEVTNTIKI